MASAGYQFLAIAGSTRHGSFTRAMAASLDEYAPDDVAVEVFNGIGDLPLYSEDLQHAGFPPFVERLGERIAAADAIVVISPEYNHSMPGVLKNALDWVSRLPSAPFAAKPTAIQTASPGFLGGARAYEHVRQVLVAMNALVLNRPEVIVPQAATKIDGDAGVVRDHRLRQEMGQQMAALAMLVRPRLLQVA